MLVGACDDEATLGYVDRFAIEHRPRMVESTDLDEVTAILIANHDTGVVNRLVRQARRRGIPLHVDERPLVSDFTRLELLERSPSSTVRRSRPSRP